MFKAVLALLGFGLAATVSSPALAYEPYPDSPAINQIYNLLFCDDATAFKPEPNTEPADWQQILYGPSQDPAKIAGLAQTLAAESRVRILAFNWLRAHGQEVAKQQVLGVIIEVPLDHGLDVLAIYADGRIRYISQTGNLSFIEPDTLPVFTEHAKLMMSYAETNVVHFKPWNKARLPPPVRPNVRITFVASDGFYLKEGLFDAMANDSVGRPAIKIGGELLSLIAQNTK